MATIGICLARFAWPLRSVRVRAATGLQAAVIAAAAGLGWPASQAAPPLKALNSYGQPPYVPATNERVPGLAAAFIQLVNEAAGPERRFELEQMPRRRLEVELERADFSGIALFLAPEFLAPAAQRGGNWSVPVMIDENLIVSTRRLRLTSLADLHGLRFGGIAGHIYRLLAPLVEAGRIEREDVGDHASNLGKLCLGRIDFMVISKSEFAGTAPHVQCPQAFVPMAFPEPQVVVRRVLVRVPEAQEARHVLDAIAAVACGARWADELARFELSSAGCRARESRAEGAAKKGLQNPKAQRAARR